MATVTVNRPDVFPDGTSVSAYARQSPVFPLPGEDDAPIGAAAATATVASGSAALTALADGTRYVIAGLVGGKWRRIYVRTAEVSTGLASVQTPVTQANGLPHPKWRQRRRAISGLV